MAVLSTSDRQKCREQFSQDVSAIRETVTGITRTDLLAAVNAIDDWIETNQSVFNLAIPLPARTSLTTKQKARLFFFIARKRFEVF